MNGFNDSCCVAALAVSPSFMPAAFKNAGLSAEHFFAHPHVPQTSFSHHNTARFSTPPFSLSNACRNRPIRARRQESGCTNAWTNECPPCNASLSPLVDSHSDHDAYSGCADTGCEHTSGWQFSKEKRAAWGISPESPRGLDLPSRPIWRFALFTSFLQHKECHNHT